MAFMCLGLIEPGRGPSSVLERKPCCKALATPGRSFRHLAQSSRRALFCDRSPTKGPTFGGPLQEKDLPALENAHARPFRAAWPAQFELSVFGRSSTATKHET